MRGSASYIVQRISMLHWAITSHWKRLSWEAPQVFQHCSRLLGPDISKLLGREDDAHALYFTSCAPSGPPIILSHGRLAKEMSEKGHNKGGGSGKPLPAQQTGLFPTPPCLLTGKTQCLKCQVLASSVNRKGIRLGRNILPFPIVSHRCICAQNRSVCIFIFEKRPQNIYAFFSFEILGMSHALLLLN